MQKQEPCDDPLTQKVFKMHCLFGQKPPPHFFTLSFPYPMAKFALLTSLSLLTVTSRDRERGAETQREKEREPEKKRLRSLTD